MLDKRCFAILNIINDDCQNSGYKVFSLSELIDRAPSIFGLDALGVSECVNTLSSHEYISVKYQDDLEICACPLPKGRLVFEKSIDEKIEREGAKKLYLSYAFFGAFSGAVCGIIVMAIIFILSGVR